MNSPRVPPRFVPTLTEVVEFEEALVLDEPVPVLADAPQADASASVVEASHAAVSTEEVPAFLLATQPVQVWMQPADQSIHAVPASSIETRNAASNEIAVAAMPEAAWTADVAAPDVPTDAVTVEPIAAAAEPDVAHDAPAEHEQIVQNVLTELQRRADLMLEYRLRETLTPILARLCDALIKDARQDLAATMRDVVSRAVAQELARHRPK